MPPEPVSPAPVERPEPESYGSFWDPPYGRPAPVVPGRPAPDADAYAVFLDHAEL